MDLTTVDKLLTTTRSVRRRLDLTRPVDPAIIEQCLEIAVQAPVGGNSCHYHFVVVADPAKRAAIARLYRQVFAEAFPASQLEQRRRTEPRDVESWLVLAERLQDVPLLIIPCIEGRPEGRSPDRLVVLYSNIMPAAWSLMLALRARGLGCAWTTLALQHERQIAELLAIPKNVTAAALLPVAYFTGRDFRPAKRVPARERTYWDSWGDLRR
jgi:nitroreductase